METPDLPFLKPGPFLMHSIDHPPRSHRKLPPPMEFKVVQLRECPFEPTILDNPETCARYWREHIVNHPYHDPCAECLVVLALNTRRRIIGHRQVATGTLDTLLVHAREVFKPAICTSAAAIVVMHNHPSGDPTPSEADIRVTRDLIRAGQLLKIEVLDHIIMGRPCPDRPKEYSSLKELGLFYN
jgi:DNA repair protein RadC